jgi:hypothetical protein
MTSNLSKLGGQYRGCSFNLRIEWATASEKIVKKSDHMDDSSLIALNNARSRTVQKVFFMGAK